MESIVFQIQDGDLKFQPIRSRIKIQDGRHKFQPIRSRIRIQDGRHKFQPIRSGRNRRKIKVIKHARGKTNYDVIRLSR